MIDILRNPDDIRIICDGENTDAVCRTELSDGGLCVYVKSCASRPSFICMRWNCPITEPTRIMGDKWERSYADMEWRSLNGESFMPWYFLASDENETVGCGVTVQPNCFVSFQCDASGVTAWLDVRSGSKGVQLNGRELLACVIVCEHYSGMTPYRAAVEFCKLMCPNPVLPKEPVYGSNNWYYAYGVSSYEEIMKDAKIISELSKSNENAPYMIIDDGWSPNLTAGPWIANSKFSDMRKTAQGIKDRGAKPGIWFRPLHDIEVEGEHPEWRIQNHEFLDPSREEVLEYVKNTVSNIKSQGYELIKHDYTTYDIFGKFGYELNGMLCAQTDCVFNDETKTSAEIVLGLYRVMREAAGEETVIIACNAISHLSAGLFEVYRTGDDTSGRVWSRTRAIGVNTLAFRLCQNNTFYKVDADCVGLLDDNIPWVLNKQWLDLVARSGSVLFASVKPESLTDEIKKDISAAMAVNSLQTDDAEPLDWMYNNQPQRWCINGEVFEYDFIMNSYPALLSDRIQPYE